MHLKGIYLLLILLVFGAIFLWNLFYSKEGLETMDKESEKKEMKKKEMDNEGETDTMNEDADEEEEVDKTDSEKKTE